jgi:hypothetical protein
MRLLRGRPTQGVLEVGLDVLDVLDAHRHPHQVRAYAGALLLGFRQLLVGGGRRVDDQRLGIADVGQVTGQLDVVDELPGRVGAALDAEVEHGAEAVRRYFFASS